MAYSTESCCPRTKHMGVLQQLQIAKNQARLWEWPPLVNCMVHKCIDKRGGSGIGNFAYFRGKGLFRWRHIQWCVKDGEWNGAHSFNSPFGRREWLLVCETEGRMSQNSWERYWTVSCKTPMSNSLTVFARSWFQPSRHAWCQAQATNLSENYERKLSWNFCSVWFRSTS